MLHGLGVRRGTWLVAACWALAAVADGFRNPPTTAEALGKAGKHIVWVDDPSALYFNPANLSECLAPQAQLSAVVGYSRVTYEGPLGHTETERPWSLLPAAAMAWPLPGSAVTAGFGVYVPYGRQTRWDPDGDLRYAAPVYSQMTVLDLTPAVAWRVSESLSVGAGLDVYYGRLQFKQHLPVLPSSRVSADADGWGCGGNAGVTWRPTPRQRLALTCRTPFDLTFDGDLETEALPWPAADSSGVETTFKFPTIVALGYGVQVTETVRLEANVEWLQFSRFKTMSVQAGDNQPLVDAMGLGHAPQNWDDTWTFGVGCDWQVTPVWSLRAGYLYLPSPIPDETFAPSALDVDQSLVSVGVGYQSGSHALDVAYAVGLFETRRVASNQNPLYAQSDYAFDGHLVAVTYTYSF